MPVNFRRAYERRLQTWSQSRSRDLNSVILAKDPHTGKWVDASITSYADDVKEINIAANAEEAAISIAKGTYL